MKLLLTINKDTITGEATTAPQFSRNVAEAKREWGYAISEIAKNNPKIPVKDYQLYAVGTFNTETLEIQPKVDFLANAADYIKE